MKNHTKTVAPTKIALAAALTVMQVGAAMAQEAAPAPKGGLNLDEVIVTATPEARPKMRQSLSVSSLSSDQITDSGATSTAEILRSIPGLRAEASSGEGNANVTVRGVPISAGGSRYVQFQEDGLPVLLFGDFNFITPDMFIRADYGTDGLEVVRGGSASTLATNAAGGVINFLSKTAEQPGGSVGVTTNVGKGTSRRVDFAYGTRVSETSGLQFSGFLRNGEGLRQTAGANLESGGQVRVAFNKDLGGGNNAKLYLKVLDDKTPTNLPVPVRVVNGKIQQLDGVDPRTFSPYASNLPTVPNFGQFGGKPADINNGIRSKTTAFGGEFNLNVGDGWLVNEKFRISRNSGEFNGILPNNYADGASNPTSNSQSSYNALYLGARFNDAGLSVNDVKATKAWQVADGKLTTTGGLFLASQKLNLDWEIGGFSSTLPVNSGTTYGTYSSFYKRALNLTYDSVAPYMALGFEKGDWNFDASARQDRQHVTGTYQGGSDPVNGVDYRSTLESYSLGANYKLTKDLATFARISRGGALPSDRKTLESFPSSCGNHCLVGVKVEPYHVTQYEGGIKFRQGNLSTFVTLFHAKTTESNADIVNNGGATTVNRYEATGVEVESGYRMGNFRINGGVTLTDAKVKDSKNMPYIGKAPNRQAKVIFQVAPSYSLGPITVGASVVGTTKSRDGQTTALEVELPAYTYVNAFARYELNASTSVSLAANNLFDKVGYTESNTDRAAARSINGRTVSLSLRHNF